MKAWAAGVAGRRRRSFCEQCGASGLVPTRRRVADRPARDELLACRGCALLTCQACWPGPFLRCRACSVREDPALIAILGEPRPSGPVALAAADAPGAAGQRAARPTRAALIAAALVAAVALTGGAVLVGRPAPETGGVAGLTARASPTAPASPPARPTGTPTMEPATPEPTREPARSGPPAARPGTPADLVVGSSAVLPWTDSLGQVRAQVLVGIANRGGTAGYLPSAGSSYEVLSADGFAVAQGRFAHVFPPLVEPGATAWLVDTISATFADPSELESIEVELHERPAPPGDATGRYALAVSDVEWHLDAAGSLSASGVVRNVGRTAVSRWSAGIVLVGAGGEPLAAAYDVGVVGDLPPGATRAFSTAYPGSPPVRPDEVAEVFAAAVPLD